MLRSHLCSTLSSNCNESNLAGLWGEVSGLPVVDKLGRLSGFEVEHARAAVL